MSFKSAIYYIQITLKLLLIKQYNYLNFIWKNYGSFKCDSIFHYGKTQLKIAKVCLHLKFLKTCQHE